MNLGQSIGALALRAGVYDDDEPAADHAEQSVGAAVAQAAPRMAGIGQRIREAVKASRRTLLVSEIAERIGVPAVKVGQNMPFVRGLCREGERGSYRYGIAPAEPGKTNEAGDE